MKKKAKVRTWIGVVMLEKKNGDACSWARTKGGQLPSQTTSGIHRRIDQGKNRPGGGKNGNQKTLDQEDFLKKVRNKGGVPKRRVNQKTLIVGPSEKKGGPEGKTSETAQSKSEEERG